MKKIIKKIIRILLKNKYLRVKFINLAQFITEYTGATINSYEGLLNKPLKERIREVTNKMGKVTGTLMMCIDEVYQLAMAVRNTAKIEGDIAEVGVANGGSAKIICEYKGNKALHLFDTFSGLPEPTEKDDRIKHHKGEFACNLESTKEFLKDCKNVYFYKGIFPGTSEPVKNKKFSFVNLDVDLYEGALDCLNFFYPRMNKGGVIMFHDYNWDIGVKTALDEFFKDKPEPAIEMSGTQCLIVKV